MSTNVELKAFTLNKVKSNGKGLEAFFTEEKVNGAEVFYDAGTKKSSMLPHPDLERLLNALKLKIAKIYYLNVVFELVGDPEFKANKKQIDILEKKAAYLVGRIRITGIAVSGKDENRGVIITATLKTETGQEVAINSQRLKFNGTKYGFESDLDDLTIDLEREVYAYLYEGKKAQQEMAFEDEANDGKMAAAGENKQLNILDQAEEILNNDKEETQGSEETDETEEEAQGSAPWEETEEHQDDEFIPDGIEVNEEHEESEE